MNVFTPLELPQQMFGSFLSSVLVRMYIACFSERKCFYAKKNLKTRVEIVTSKLLLLSLVKVAVTEELLGQGDTLWPVPPWRLKQELVMCHQMFSAGAPSGLGGWVTSEQRHTAARCAALPALGLTEAASCKSSPLKHVFGLARQSPSLSLLSRPGFSDSSLQRSGSG